MAADQKGGYEGDHHGDKVRGWIQENMWGGGGNWQYLVITWIYEVKKR